MANEVGAETHLTHDEARSLQVNLEFGLRFGMPENNPRIANSKLTTTSVGKIEKESAAGLTIRLPSKNRKPKCTTKNGAIDGGFWMKLEASMAIDRGSHKVNCKFQAHIEVWNIFTSHESD